MSPGTIEDWLSYFGYKNDEAGISSVQRAYDVPVTGVLDEVTMRAVSKLPRCGVTDAQPLGGTLDKWGLAEVSYFIDTYPVGLGLTKEQVEETVRLCFKSWSDVCGLRYVKAASAAKANIVLSTGRGRRVGFDGAGGTLAWCELPQGSNYRGQLRLMWDLDEAWTLSTSVNGILIFNTTNHEIGHANGHYHNTVKNQLLNAIYNRAIGMPQSYDIQEAQARYGKPTTVPTVPSVPTGSVPSPVNGVQAVRVLDAAGDVWYADNFKKVPRQGLEFGDQS